MKRFWNCVLVCVVILVLIFTTGCKKETLFKEGVDNSETEADIKLRSKLQNSNLSIMVYSENMQEELSDAAKTFEEKYNGKVDFSIIPQTEVEAKLAAALAAGDGFDVLKVNSKYFPSWAMKGFLQPIETYVKLNDPIWEDHIGTASKFKYKGKFYGMQGGGAQAVVVLFNKTMFENNAMKTPLELYEEGKWNWTTFRECAIQFTQDTNRDGTVDQWGFAASWQDLFILANGSDYIDFKDDGTVQLNMNDPKFIEALQFTQDATYKDKYWVRGGKVGDDFLSGKIAMLGQRPVYVAGEKNGAMKDEWDFAPFPEGPSGAKDVSPGTWGSWGIGNGAKNPEGGGVLIYLHALIKKETAEEEARSIFTEKQYELVKMLNKNINVAKYPGVNINPNTMNKELEAGTPISSAIAKYEPVFQTAIDVLMK